MLRLFRPVTPTGRQPPFGVGHSVPPLPDPSSRAFTFSRVPSRLRRVPCWRVGDSKGGGLALPRRAKPAYPVPRVSPPRRGRMPLYTRKVNGCAGSPFKLTDLPSVPLWRWGRMVARAPPALRCVIPRLQLPYPYRPFPDDATVCHAGSHRLTACLIPRRCQRRTHGSGTGGTTPG